MSSALTYIAIANFFGSQSAVNTSAITPGSIPSSFQRLFHFQPNRYNLTYAPGIGTYRAIGGSITWNAARRSCEDQGGHLAIVNSVAEAEVIAEILKVSKSLYGWVGVHDFYQEDEFVTIHGESLAQTGFDTWRPGEPNNAGGKENCVVISSVAELIDVPCENRYRGICEFPYAHDQRYSLPNPESANPEVTPEGPRGKLIPN